MREVVRVMLPWETRAIDIILVVASASYKCCKKAM